MIDLATLRVRIAELESRDMTYAPPNVRAMWEFDRKALKMLLNLLTEGKGKDAS